MILSDKHSNGPQFSKLLVVIALVLSILGCIAVLILTPPESVSVALLSVCGSLAVTTVVWHLKKSQVENTVKIYMSAYKEIIEMKQQNGEDICDEMENNILNKLNQTIDNTLEDATSIIEKQEIG